ncbi:MAG TPA: methyltransferase domain-containing protein [Ktedonobacterales bacterium]|nr:methyltransferase domain-containing protein [Ktedonobacterales bacterium]
MDFRVRDAAITEWLDAETMDDAALRRNLGDIRRINWLLGWTAFTVRGVARQAEAIAKVSGEREFSLLDVASGSADIPLAIARWADHNGYKARIVATDISPQIVAVAQEQSAETPSITVERQDALNLPYAPGSFDIALCTLAIHHFEPERAVELLAGMARVGKHVLVFDVARARFAYIGSLLLTRLLFMDAMTCHDAPASVRRAYSAPELRELAKRADLQDATVHLGIPWRLALSARGAA